ncbi:hypothetical protein HBI24_054160 [Parastagonospora nodorum]|nr:hypothetical protein HBH47_032830 [Parastagonospora nodorum]KAH4809749.1 hypothetical protein HBH61_105480 [Parastagonospora nodorum]KAH4988601.1 hypothetical protein HBI76_082710 [Parastagonospora nodorum]KAH5074801.1 hypothetical protein HBH95_135410 [Parastagonospora nodorum]KAH5224411.1 hypothetical protein HBI62_119380 [Parastagonospora nodorum]
MFSTLVYLALVQVACALSIPQADLSTRSTHVQKREISTGVKVALGICIPGAVLVVGLGLVVLLMYPAQLRKLRKQNGGQDVSLADLMNGQYPPKPKPAPPPPPPYTGHDASNAHSTEDTTLPPSYPVQPQNDTHHAAPTTGAETRHSAPMS